MHYIGTVYWYNAQKRFGFLEPAEGGGSLFFHYHDGCFLKAGSEAPEFHVSRNLEGELLREPAIGDALVFALGRSNDGRPKADPWGYLSSFKLVVEQIACRPVYRVFRQMTTIGHPPGEPELVWTGSDMSGLLRRFPVPRHSQSPSSDPLLSYYADPDNIFEVRRWWEVRQPDGSWQQCDDPRPLTGALRQFEAINRAQTNKS